MVPFRTLAWNPTTTNDACKIVAKKLDIQKFASSWLATSFRPISLSGS